LRQGCKDDDNKFQSIHALSSNNISKGTKSKLTDDGSTTGSNLDGGIRVGWYGTLLRLVNYSEHSGEQTNSEDVVGISEKSHSGDNTSPDMVPVKA
jgi:hypothetical protein